MAKSIYVGVKKKINDFADWILKYVPGSVNRPVNENVEALQQQVDDIFENLPIFEIQESASALQGFTHLYTIDGQMGFDAQSFLDAVEITVTDLMSRNRQTRIHFVLTCTMERRHITTGEVETTNAHFHSLTETILEATDVTELYRIAVDKIMDSLDVFLRNGSGWRFRSVVNLGINTVVYEPFRGNSYIRLSKKLANKKAIINLKNDDNQCFKWCITRALNPVVKNAEK